MAYFFDNERELLCFLEAWNSIDSNKRIGLITANDSEGVEISTFINDFAVMKGYTVIDPGRYNIGEVSYTDKISVFEESGCDIILGVMNTEDFRIFWEQLMETNYRPKMCTVAKSCLFQSDVIKLGDLGNGLISEVWWNEDFPFLSSITGWTSEELAMVILKIVSLNLLLSLPR
jgi:branched-chain amino acid transport system substrate-binding protein